MNSIYALIVLIGGIWAFHNDGLAVVVAVSLYAILDRLSGIKDAIEERNASHVDDDKE
jgi:hypothetical protein